MEIPKRCPECGSEEIWYDRETGEFVCKGCGLVVGRIVKGVVSAPVGVANYVIVDVEGRTHRFEAPYRVPGPVEVVVARVVKSRVVLKDSLKAIREYRPTLADLLAPPEEKGRLVENVVVTLRQVVRYSGYCLIHERDEDVTRVVEKTRVFPFIEVSTFKRLLGLKKVKGYRVSPVDGVKAFLIACRCGTKSFIYGFLKAMSGEFPELKTTAEHVGETLSRLKVRGWVGSTGRVLGEAVYCIFPEKRARLLRSSEWWRD